MEDKFLKLASCALTETGGFQVRVYVCALLSPAVLIDTSKWPCSGRSTVVFEGRACEPCGFMGPRALKWVNGTGTYKYSELVLQAE